MRVRLVREPEVALRFGAVLRLLERSQHDRLQQFGIRPPLHHREQFRVVLRLRLVTATERQAELGQELAQSGELLDRRTFVDAIQRGVLVALQEVRRADVRGEHAFLDDAVGVVAFDAMDVADLAVVAELHLRLDRLEVDRATPRAGLHEDTEELLECAQMRQHGRQSCGRFRRRIAERGPDLVVRQTRLRMHHRGMEGIAHDIAAWAEIHLADHAQAIDAGVERTDAVRQRLRQHRDHAPREVHRVAAVGRLEVERIAGTHVVAHVRDRDVELETLALGIAVDRIVEVARRLAIDRDERQIAQIDTAGEIAFRDRQGDGLRTRFGFRAEHVRHLVLAHRDLDLHAGIGRITQHLDDVPDRGAVARRLLHEPHDHDLAGLRVRSRLLRDEHVVRDATVRRRDLADAVLDDVAPHHFRGAMLDHFDDAALDPTTPVDTDAARHDAVTVHHLRHLARRKEHVLAVVVGDEESVAFGMPLHHARDEIEFLRDAQHTAAIDQDLTSPRHRLETARERLVFLRLDRERLGERLGRERLSCLFHHVENELARRQGIFVFAALAFEIRIRASQCFRTARIGLTAGSRHRVLPHALV
jgi:hypothetical protein